MAKLPKAANPIGTMPKKDHDRAVHRAEGVVEIAAHDAAGHLGLAEDELQERRVVRVGRDRHGRDREGRGEAEVIENFVDLVADVAWALAQVSAWPGKASCQRMRSMRQKPKKRRTSPPNMYWMPMTLWSVEKDVAAPETERVMLVAVVVVTVGGRGVGFDRGGIRRWEEDRPWDKLPIFTRFSEREQRNLPGRRQILETDRRPLGNWDLTPSPPSS